MAYNIIPIMTSDSTPSEVGGAWLFITLTYGQLVGAFSIIGFMVSSAETFPLIKDISLIAPDFSYTHNGRMDLASIGADDYIIYAGGLSGFASAGIGGSDCKISMLLPDGSWNMQSLATYDASTGEIESGGVSYAINCLTGSGSYRDDVWGKYYNGPDMFCFDGDYCYSCGYDSFMSKINRLSGVRDWQIQLPWDYYNYDLAGLHKRSMRTSGYSCAIAGGYLWINGMRTDSYLDKFIFPYDNDPHIKNSWILLKYDLNGNFISETVIKECISGSPNYYNTYPAQMISDSSGNIYISGYDKTTTALGNIIIKVGAWVSATVCDNDWVTQMCLSEDEDYLFYCSSAGYIIGCINTTTGAIVWEVEMTGGTWGYQPLGLSYYNGYLYVLSHEWDLTIKISKHDPETGEEHPKYPAGGEDLLYTEAWDFDWNQKGFVALDSDLEPVLALEASISYATKHVAAMSQPSVETRYIDTWGTPYLWDSWLIDGGRKAWSFRVNNVEHYDRVYTLKIGSTVIETNTVTTSYDQIIRYADVVTSASDPEPPPPELIAVNWTNTHSASGRTYSGTMVNMHSPNAGWIDEDHHIYAKEYRTYKDGATTMSQYDQKTYLVINGVETLLYENDHTLDDGYFYNMNGYILIGIDDYSEGAAVFHDGDNYRYIASIAFNSYDPVLVKSPFWEFFHYDGTTLTRKTFTIDTDQGGSQLLALLGNIGGTDIYTCGDITIK